MSEVIAAQTLPVCLVVIGDDLGKTLFIIGTLVNRFLFRYYSSI
jgi:hypothetical protein